MIDFQSRHWGIALVTALAAHGTMLGFFWEAPPSGARSAGLGGMEVSLGPAGSAPGAEAAAPPAPEEAASVPPTDIAATTAPEQVATVDAVPVPVEKPPRPVEEVQPVESVEVSRLAEVRPIRSAPLPKVKPRPPKRPEPKPQVVRPVQPERIVPAEPEAPVKPTERNELALAKAAPAAPGAGGRSGTRTDADSGSGETQSGGGLPGASADYMLLLRAWLEKHKEYPRAARIRGQEGAAVLWFAIDPEGRILEYSIRRSSGYASLDREVIAMIKRAAPLPPMPHDMSRDRLEVVVPVQFHLR